jgi:hypothetical protein
MIALLNLAPALFCAAVAGFLAYDIAVSIEIGSRRDLAITVLLVLAGLVCAGISLSHVVAFALEDLA